MKPGGIISPPYAPVKFHRLQMNRIGAFDPHFPSHSIPPLQISSSPPHKRIFSPRNAVPALLKGSRPFFFRFFFSPFLIHFIAPGEGGFPSGSCVMQSKNNSTAAPSLCPPEPWEGTTIIPLEWWRDGENPPQILIYINRFCIWCVLSITFILCIVYIKCLPIIYTIMYKYYKLILNYCKFSLIRRSLCMWISAE